jgi:hypothetical protein
MGFILIKGQIDFLAWIVEMQAVACAPAKECVKKGERFWLEERGRDINDSDVKRDPA